MTSQLVWLGSLTYHIVNYGRLRFSEQSINFNHGSLCRSFCCKKINLKSLRLSQKSHCHFATRCLQRLLYLPLLISVIFSSYIFGLTERSTYKTNMVFVFFKNKLSYHYFILCFDNPLKNSLGMRSLGETNCPQLIQKVVKNTNHL